MYATLVSLHGIYVPGFLVFILSIFCCVCHMDITETHLAIICKILVSMTSSKLEIDFYISILTFWRIITSSLFNFDV